MNTNLTTWLTAVKERLEKATPKQFLDSAPTDLTTAVKIIERQAKALKFCSGVTWGEGAPASHEQHQMNIEAARNAQADVAKILEGK